VISKNQLLLQTSGLKQLALFEVGQTVHEIGITQRGRRSPCTGAKLDQTNRKTTMKVASATALVFYFIFEGTLFWAVASATF